MAVPKKKRSIARVKFRKNIWNSQVILQSKKIYINSLKTFFLKRI
jgi:hypothetical protein